MKNFKYYISALIITVAFTSCKKEGCTDPSATNYKKEAKKDDGSCQFENFSNGDMQFQIRWANAYSPFEFGEDYSHPATGENINFERLNFYISNVKLKKADGTWWKENESYHLIKASAGNVNPSLTIKNIPNGEYTELAYMIGVDSTRNVSGAQEGALSVSENMFWNWNSGYIFVKAEGTSTDSPNGNFSYHLGGFREDNNTNAIQEKTHAFGGSTIVIDKNSKADFKLLVNIARFWHGGIQIENIPMVHMPGQNAITFATNFADGFILESY